MVDTISKRYKVITGDPAWDYSAWNPKTSERWVGHKYDVMSVDDICAMGPDVERLADPEGSVLFLWGTWPHLPNVLRVMAAWGFEYKTCAFDWFKTTSKGTLAMGMGFYTRSNSEFCLLGIRGKPLPRKSHSVPMALEAPGTIWPGIAGDPAHFDWNDPLNLILLHEAFKARRREHSRKPDEFYPRVMKLFDGPYIELFARQQWPGWDTAFSNQSDLFPAQPFLFDSDVDVDVGNERTPHERTPARRSGASVSHRRRNGAPALLLPDGTA